MKKDFAYLVDIVTNNLCGTAIVQNKLYYTNLSTIKPSTYLKQIYHQSNIADASPNDLWSSYHNRLHRPKSTIEKLIRHKNAIIGLNIEQSDIPTDIPQCLHCWKAQMDKIPINTAYPHGHPEDIVGGQVVTDICGPLSIVSIDGFTYIASFIDVYSNYKTIYFLKSKDAIADALEQYIVYMRKYNHSIKRIHHDNAKEYLANTLPTQFQAICNNNNILFSTTPGGYAPQANQKAERYWRTLFNDIRTRLDDSGLPKYLWSYAARYSNYLFNRTKLVEINEKCFTSYELFTGNKSDISNIKRWGCSAVTAIDKSLRTKLQDKGTLGYFVSFAENSFAIQLYIPDKHHVSEHAYVLFDELRTYHDHLKSRPSLPSESTSIPTVSSRTPTMPLHMNIRSRPSITSSNESEELAMETIFMLPHIAWKDKNWRDAMIKELQALIDNKTWILETMPSSCHAIKNIWVYKIKDNTDEIRYKARLTIDGRSQIHGIDYDETYSPVIRLTTFRTLLAISASKNLTLYQFDFDNAFLNAEISNDVPPIYMEPPYGYDFQSECQQQGLTPSNNVKLRLRKTLYGLKQSPRAWFAMLNKYILDNGYELFQSDICLYKRIQGKSTTYIALYVDDMIIATNDLAFFTIFKKHLLTNYRVKDIGILKHYLGIRIDQTDQGIVIDQSRYIDKLLHKFRLQESKKDVKIPLSNSDETYLEGLLTNVSIISTDKPYRELIGSLMYAMLGSRPDIAYAISFFSRYVNNATDTHFKIALKVLMYLKSTINRKIVYKRNVPIILKGFVDANYATCKSTRRSTSGYIFYLGDAPISWTSKRQSIVALSSNEAEFIALTDATKEAIYLRNLLNEFNILQSSPTILYEDNTGAIALSNNPIQHGKLKHISIRRFWLREQVINHSIVIHHISSKYQIGDLLTKALNLSAYQMLIESLYDLTRLDINSEQSEMWSSDNIIPFDHTVDSSDLEYLSDQI